MTTIVNNPGPERTVERVAVVETDSGAGWIIAIIILLVVIGFGAYYWQSGRTAPASPASGGTNINVALPAPTIPTAPADQGTSPAQPGPL